MKKLDMSQCGLSQREFFELIPIILKTEIVIIQRNPISDIDLKIFSTQFHEAKGHIKLKSLDISSSSLTDESLKQISKFAFLIENLDLQDSTFGHKGLECLLKCFQESEVKSLQSLNMRMCKLTDDCLEPLSQIIPYLSSVTLSSNNFSAATGVRLLVTRIDQEEDYLLRHLDLRYSRVSQDMKKILGDLCRRKKIELKVW